MWSHICGGFALKFWINGGAYMEFTALMKVRQQQFELLPKLELVWIHTRT